MNNLDIDNRNPLTPQHSKVISLIAWAVLILFPATIYITNNNLFPSIALDSWLSTVLYWLTSTGTAPYGIITGLVILAVCYRSMSKELFVKLVLAVSISMAATLSLNHFLKPHFAEPRPNAALLEQEYLLNTHDFYQHDKAEKRQIIGVAINQLDIARPDLKLSDAIKRHWQHEVGYAFPSGHTLFAVTLTLVASFYLLQAGNIALPVLLFSWALVMGFSRMLLGMHWPQDVLASTAIGGAIAALSIYITQIAYVKWSDIFSKTITTTSRREPRVKNT